MLERDIRATPLFEEANEFYRLSRRVGTGQLHDISDISVSPRGDQAVFCGSLMDTLDGEPATLIGKLDLATGDIRILTFGAHADTLPKYSPCGRYIAFLSDRAGGGLPQLHFLDENASIRPTPRVNGRVEYHHWSPSGASVLLGVAGVRSDTSAARGAVRAASSVDNLPAWIPSVEAGSETDQWRRLSLFDVASRTVSQLIEFSENVWEAVWCGNSRIAALCSNGPEEGLWYGAALRLFDLSDGTSREVHRPSYQLGCLSASPSGKHIAFVEGLCSDRGFVAGDLHLFDVDSGYIRHTDTRDVDVTYTEWCAERRLLIAGHRGLETVVGLLDLPAGTFVEIWAGRETTASGIFATVAALNDQGDCLLVSEGFLESPAVGMIRAGAHRIVRSFDGGYNDYLNRIATQTVVNWEAADGLPLEGWLLLPAGGGKNPLVMQIHGGPVWHWRPLWLGRRGAAVVMLLSRGCAVFFPNPRGSTGRGQEFARRVLGDIGGADATDCLMGIDHLVRSGMADPRCLGLTGTSYGGYLTSWLVTQDSRFAAAVSVAPITNLVTERFLSNIPHFVEAFAGDRFFDTTGRYYQRSPLLHVHKATTPTLNICGALDRCTPAVEAAQFHYALRQQGSESALITYPQEGHGVRNFPAAADYAARVVGWFDSHMGPLGIRGSERR